jgi:hypothetical protein
METKYLHQIESEVKQFPFRIRLTTVNEDILIVGKEIKVGLQSFYRGYRLDASLQQSMYSPTLAYCVLLSSKEELNYIRGLVIGEVLKIFKFTYAQF